MKRATTIITIIILFVMTGCASLPRVLSPLTPAQRQHAMDNAAEAVRKTFGATVTPDEMILEEWSGGRDTIWVGGKNDFSYYVCTAHATGTVQHVSRNYDHVPLTEAQRQQAEAYNPFNPINENQTNAESEVQGEAMAEACTPVAVDLILRSFAEGRTVVETKLGFCMTDSEMEPVQQVGINVHMSEGECYTVTVLWPQLVVAEVTTYPLGWHSCVYGYFHPLEAVQYPPLDANPALMPTMTPEPAGDGGEVSVIGITELPNDAKIYVTTFYPEESARIELSPLDCLAITELLDGKELIAVTPACDSDILLETEDARFAICSACGSFSTGIDGANGSATLSEAEVDALCDLLKQYGLGTEGYQS